MKLTAAFSSILPLRKLLDSFNAALQPSSSRIEAEIDRILDDLESIRKARAWIQAVLLSNEEMAVRGDETVRLWLSELQESANRASDLLGLYEYGVVAQKVWDREQQSSSTASVGRKRKLQELEEVNGRSTSSVLLPTSSPLIDPRFRRIIVDGILKFQERFVEINNEKEALDLELEEDGISTIYPDRQSASYNQFEVVIGREEEEKELIKFLISSTYNKEKVPDSDTNNKKGVDVPVAALVGMGGVGKTTLARCAYNNEEVRKQFDMRAWVWVSNDNQILTLTQKISEAFGQEESSDDLRLLQVALKKKVRGKRFLLVLDDVWIEHSELWNDLFRGSLNYGAQGSRVIITTRNQTVAISIQAKNYMPVNSLSLEDGWSLFQMCAFDENRANLENLPPSLIATGKRIAEKCKGLPLALKVLGRCLRHNQGDEQAWTDMLESDMWESHTWEEGKQVLGPLILSYLHLPAQLKPCFKICSVYPKSHTFSEYEVASLWMAHELVEDYDENVGMAYIAEFISRSFFQYYSIHGRQYLVMHDLIHDVAQYFSRDNVFHVLPSGGETRQLYVPTKSEHVYIRASSGTTVQLCNHNQNSVDSLRTILVESKVLLGVQSPRETIVLDGLRILTCNQQPNNDLLKLLKNSKNLRHLYLYTPTSEMIVNPICTLYNLRSLEIGCGPPHDLKLPDSIGDLKHLVHFNIEGVVSELPDAIGRLTNLRSMRVAVSIITYLPDSISRLVQLKALNLYNTKISTLPDSIGNLKNLQLLNLHCCFYLHKLPRSLVNLTNLQELDLDSTPGVCYLPAGFGKLKQLRRLPIFRVSSTNAADHAGIAELRDLVKISDKVSIVHLANVVSEEDALQANLASKEFLRSLELEWGDLRTFGTCRIDDDFAKDQGSVMAVNDEKVLQKLRPNVHLERLGIKEWRGLRLASWLGDESFVKLSSIMLRDLCNCNSLWPLNQLPSLKELCLDKMPALSSPTEQGNSVYFPVLEALQISHCPRLASLPDMPLLRRLHLRHCESLTCFPPLPMLEELSMSSCPRVTGLPSQIMSFVKKLNVDRCGALTYPFPALEELCISGCLELTILPNHVSAIRNLKLHKCDSMICIPLYKLPKLEELCIDECKNMQRIEFEERTLSLDQQHQPNSSSSNNKSNNIHRTSLKSLTIEDCPELRFSDSTVLPSSLNKLEVSKCPSLQEWCSVHRQSRLAHLPEVREWNILFLGSGARYSNPDY